MSSVSDRIYQMTASASDGLPVLKVEAFKPIDKNNFALIFSSIATNKDFNQAEYSAALNSITDNKLSIVADSIFRIESNKVPVMRCIAASNIEAIPAKQETIASMKKISANVLEDDNGIMWKMVGDGDNRHIVQVSQEDFGELLAKRRRITQMTASVEDGLVIDYRDTDYVYFMNPEIEAMDFGFMVKASNKDYVVSRALKAPVKVLPHQIVEAAGTNGGKINLTQRRREIAAANSSDPTTAYINYLKELYGAKSDYVKDYEKAIRGSANRVA